jgi:uncharacterized protein with HEPN domain
MRCDRERLRDILEAIARIERHTGGEPQAVGRSEVVQDAVLRHLQIIGEAARALSPDFRAGHPDVPWAKIIGMRHILVHHYFDIDESAVSEVLARDLPDLRKRTAAILDQMGDTD